MLSLVIFSLGGIKHVAPDAVRCTAGASCAHATTPLRLFYNLAHEVLPVNRVALLDAELGDLARVRCRDDHFLDNTR